MGRRGRWLSFDSSFYDGKVGLMIRERFGPVGLVLFSAFLCACKRNSVPGQIEYANDLDCLALFGLPGMDLVDEDGQRFELDTFWKSLGDYKQISRRQRGRLTQVRSSRWEHWQQDRKSKPPVPEKPTSGATDTEPIPPDSPPDLHLRQRPRHDHDTTTTNTPPSPPPPSAELVLAADYSPQAATGIGSKTAAVFEAWREATGRTSATLLDDKRKRLIRKALSTYPLDDVLDAVRGWRNSAHHRGENAAATTYNDLELLLRDSAHIEKFRDLERNGPAMAVPTAWNAIGAVK